MVDRASVLMVVVLSAVFLGENLTPKTAAAAILVFIGLLLPCLAAQLARGCIMPRGI